MSKKNELATTEENTVAIVSEAINFAADAGSGMEGAGADSFAIPFLTVLQKISPQCDEADAKYIEGAKGGQLFNSVTGQLYDGKEGVIFLPAAYQRRFLRWGARGADGAGFKGEVMPEDVAALRDNGTVVEQDGRLYYPLPDGSINDKKCDHLADVRNHFGIIVNADGTYSQALLSLGSTQIKKSKLLMSLLSAVKVKTTTGMVTPPTWANRVRITSVAESNDKGSWSGYKFELEGFVTDKDQYDAAKAFHAAISGGTAGVVKYEETDTTPASDKF